jgi:hypothetical protein
VVGSFRNAAAVRAFAEDVDVLTVEIEHIDADAMQQVSRLKRLTFHRQKRHMKMSVQELFGTVPASATGHDVTACRSLTKSAATSSRRRGRSAPSRCSPASASSCHPHILKATWTAWHVASPAMQGGNEEHGQLLLVLNVTMPVIRNFLDVKMTAWRVASPAMQMWSEKHTDTLSLVG